MAVQVEVVVVYLVMKPVLRHCLSVSNDLKLSAQLKLGMLLRLLVLEITKTPELMTLEMREGSIVFTVDKHTYYLYQC